MSSRRSQATIRDLERELGVTRRDMKDKEAATIKELQDNRARIQALHKKLQKLEVSFWKFSAEFPNVGWFSFYQPLF